MTTLEMTQKLKIEQLERELMYYRYKAEPPYTGQDIDLGKMVITPTVQIYLWGMQEAIIDRLSVTAIAKNADGFSLYYKGDAAQIMTPWQEATLFDKLQEKLRTSFASHLTTKYK